MNKSASLSSLHIPCWGGMRMLNEGTENVGPENAGAENERPSAMGGNARPGK